MPSLSPYYVFHVESECKCSLLILQIIDTTSSYEVLLLAKKCVSILQPQKFDAEFSAMLVKRLNLSSVLLITLAIYKSEVSVILVGMSDDFLKMQVAKK